MGFKENLLKKMNIDQLARRVIRSLKPSDGGTKFDKVSMREMLSMGAYPQKQTRDMDLYLLENNSEKKKILVLDNGLAIYNTTIEDVCLRKSPTVKEMLSIRNAIKILNDKDVVLSKKEDSVRTVQTDVIMGIDLAYTAADLDQIEKEGQASLENSYADGVLEALTLFAELIGYREAPKAFRVDHHKVLGRLQKDAAGQAVWGPFVIYDHVHNTLKSIEKTISTANKEQMDFYRQVLDGRTEAAHQGPPVFTHLKASTPPYQ